MYTWTIQNIVNIPYSFKYGRCRSWEAPIRTAPPPAIRPIYGSIAHVGRVRPAYQATFKCPKPFFAQVPTSHKATIN
eukprot:2266727-Pleurochrysis_carterae.AAC.4